MTLGGRRVAGFDWASLGTFSPLAALAAGSPGSRALLADVERSAERALHVARGVFLALIAIVFVLQSGKSTLLVVLASAAFPLAGFLWLLAWRALGGPYPPAWLPYVLILVDVWFALRVSLVAWGPLSRIIGPQYLTPAELAAVSGSWLTCIAITGGFRLNPGLAAFSTTAALLAYLVIALVIGVSRNLGLLVGLVIVFAGLLGIQIARVFRYTMLKAREQAVLERYVPEALIEELARTGDPLGAGRETDITVLIVDIRGYTRRVERLTPRQAVAFLNDYFSVVIAPLADEGAVLDKYIGDGVFAFLEGPDHQRRAMRAARAILVAVERHNAQRPGAEPVEIGIALHTGRALVGTIGGEQKREYTAIADAVNLAARLEELNKTFPARIVASEAVIQAVAPEERVGFVGPVEVPIRGHDASMAVRYLPPTP